MCVRECGRGGEDVIEDVIFDKVNLNRLLIK